MYIYSKNQCSQSSYCMPLINITDLQSHSNLNNIGIACVSIHKPFTA